MLSPRVSDEKIRLKFLHKLFRVDSWIPQSEFQTDGPATEKARVPKVLRRSRGTNITDHNLILATLLDFYSASFFLSQNELPVVCQFFYLKSI